MNIEDQGGSEVYNALALTMDVGGLWIAISPPEESETITVTESSTGADSWLVCCLVDVESAPDPDASD